MPILEDCKNIESLVINGKTIESAKINNRYVYKKRNIITSAIRTIEMYTSKDDTIIDWGDGSPNDIIQGSFLPWNYTFSRTYYANATYHVRIYVGGVLTKEFDNVITEIGQYY